MTIEQIKSLEQTIAKLLPLPEVFRRTQSAARRGRLDGRRRSALDRLVADAAGLLDARETSVIDKTTVPGRNDKHDYFSLSPYLWPNPKRASYETRDGYSNPEAYGPQYDREPLMRMAYAAQTTAFAYAFTGEDRFAQKAARVLRTWFLDPATRMNPNMDYAQFIPGWVLFDTVFPPHLVPGGGGTGIAAEYSHHLCGLYAGAGGVIEAVQMMMVPQCAAMIARSSAWTADDRRGLKAWFGAFVRWATSSIHGHFEAHTPGNHGSWYWAWITAFAAFAGLRQRAMEAVNTAIPQRIRMQIEPDGHVGDVSRSRSLDYALFTVMSLANGAILGEGLGVDLWAQQVEGVAKIPQAIDWIAQRLGPGKEWPGRNVAGFHPWTAAPLLATAAQRLGRQDYLELIEWLPGYESDHRWRLLYPAEG